MKLLSVFGRIYILLSLMVTLACAQTPLQNDNHSIAIILKVAGEEGKISSVSIYNYNTFNARVKFDIEKFNGENTLHVKIKNQNDSTVYDNYFQNPLLKNAESYDEKGHIDRVVTTGKEEYVNVRFLIPSGTNQLRISCYDVKSEAVEKEVSNFNLNLK